MIAFSTKRLSATLFTESLIFFSLVNQAALAINSSQIVLAVQTSQIKSVSKDSKSFSGNVSWYGPHFQGRPTSSGEIFDMNKPTAAHRTLPFGTRVLVEDPKTGNTVIVKVNDRGPFCIHAGYGSCQGRSEKTWYSWSWCSFCRLLDHIGRKELISPFFAHQ